MATQYFYMLEIIFIVYTSSALKKYSMASVSHRNWKTYHTNLFWGNFLVYRPYDNFLYFLHFLKLLMCWKSKN